MFLGYNFAIMLKSLLIAAVFVALLFGRPCVSEQKHSSAHTAENKSSDTTRQVPPPSAVVNPPAAAPCNQANPCYTKDAAPEPPLPRWRRSEWVIVYVTIAYAVIAAFTLWVIKRQADTMDAKAKKDIEDSNAAALTTKATLKAIQEQAGIMREQANLMVDQKLALIESANAAKTSAEAAMGVSIPTLMLSEFGFGNIMRADLAAIYQYPNLRIAVTNYGQSPAFLKEWTVIFHCGDLPRVPIYTHSYTYEMEEVLDAGKPHFLGGGSVRPRHFFSDSEVSQMVGNHRELHVYGYVVYGNVFDAKLRRLKFSKVLWAIHDNGTHAAFTDCGGDKFLGNDYPEDQQPQNPN